MELSPGPWHTHESVKRVKASVMNSVILTSRAVLYWRVDCDMDIEDIPTTRIRKDAHADVVRGECSGTR